MAEKPAYEQLKRRVKALEGESTERQRIEEALQRQTHALGERVKELNCLYGISHLVEQHPSSVEQILQGTVNLIPPSWQYPDITCARIILEHQEFKTDNFTETTWKQVSEIMLHGKPIGSLQVYYLQERPESDEGPFLKEERALLDVIGQRLGKIVEHNSTEEVLHKRTHDLSERVKELNCLYGISSLVEKRGASLEDILQGTADLISPSWQYPDITCARIILEDQEFKTDNFTETTWKQVSEIMLHGKPIGSLQVYYLQERPESDEGPFLKEERVLLNVMAERLGKIIERKQAEEALRESEERYRILTEQVADGVILIQAGRLLFVNDAFVSMFGYTDSNGLVGKEVVDLISDEFKERFKKMYEKLEAGISGESVFQGMCLSADDRQFWIEGHNNVIKWNGKPAILGTVRDITETKLREVAAEEEAELLLRENKKLRSTIKDRFRFGNIVGKSPAMQEIYELILRAGASDGNVIIYGESGTGKELVARAVHDMSNRRKKEFVCVNSGAIPEPLVESEFFGHKKGAFTGAYVDKHGYLDFADGGTLFLDEVGDLKLSIQVKLLRAVEGGGHTPLGGRRARRSDFRIIAATNKNLLDLVNKGLMREDFFYRIHIIPITLPPLRDRKEDIALLVDHFLRSQYDGKEPPVIPGNIMQALYNYDWPGNVRELQNVLHRYLTVKRLDFTGRPSLQGRSSPQGRPSPQLADPEDGAIKAFGEVGPAFTAAAAIESFEKSLILKALERNKWHKAKAASMLGLPRRTFFRKLKHFGLTPAHIEPPSAQS